MSVFSFWTHGHPVLFVNIPLKKSDPPPNNENDTERSLAEPKRIQTKITRSYYYYYYYYYVSKKSHTVKTKNEAAACTYNNNSK